MPRRRVLSLVLLVSLALTGALAVVVLVRAFSLPSRQVQVPRVDTVPHDVVAASARLAEAVRLRTIASAEAGREPPDADAFRALHAMLARHYPAAHRAMRREVVAGLTLLYTWPGRDATARPILLMAHQDVVPVAEGTQDDWTHPPFSGALAGGFVWGRGAWDDKGNLIAMMEAVESLASTGFVPSRTIHFVFGHDEETLGSGAKAAAELLASRGTRLEFVLDEGLVITEGMLKGLSGPAALVGVAEKGYLSLELLAKAPTGHSSMPPARTAIGALAEAVVRLRDRPMPGGLREQARELFETLAPEMQGINRVLLSNLWLFGPLVSMQLQKDAGTNATLRTTVAPTVIQAGERENVLPGQARAVFNFRLLPGDSSDAVAAHAARAVDGTEVVVSKRPGFSEASPVSRTDAAGYRLIARTLRELHPDVVVAPGLMLGITDSRHFLGIADQVYRFSPVRARPEDLPRFHGTNERVAVSNLGELIQFYRRLLVNAAGAPAGKAP